MKGTHIVLVTTFVLFGISEGGGKSKKGKTAYLPRCKFTKASLLVHPDSKRCMDAGSSNGNDGLVVLLDCVGGPEQTWIGTYVDGGFYQIFGYHSSAGLALGGDKTDDGSPLSYILCNKTDDNQLFKFQPIKAPAFQLVVKKGGKCVVPTGTAKTDNTQLVINQCQKTNAAQACVLDAGKGPGNSTGNGASSGDASKGKCALWQAKVPGGKVKAG